jgi:hypothetical protein
VRSPASAGDGPGIGARFRRLTAAHWLVIGVTGLLLLVFAPALARGGPLADDYIFCLRPIQDGGYGPFLRDIWHDTGVVRPARLIELFLISKTCMHVRFGVIMLVPLSLKFAAGVLLWGLLYDVRLRTPWPEVGVAMWLLEPVGTEAALWPAALHVHLGLVCALAALRLYGRGSLVWASLAGACAALSVEQVIFALPLALWLTAPREHRRRATVTAGVLMAVAVVAFATWPGQDPRQALTLAARWQNVVSKGRWYVFFPAAGLGLYSGAIGFLWAFPYSLGVVVGGAMSGALLFARLLRHQTTPPLESRARVRAALALGILVILVNLPLIVTEVGYSARTFTPTWLVLSGAFAAAGASIAWKRARVVGAIAGTFAAFAILSLALSVSVRVRTATFNQAAAQWIAARTQDGSIVAICDVDRTVVNPAPLGSFHLHEFHGAWSSWIEYHTGRRVEIRRSGQRYWGSRCPDLRGASLVISFPRLVSELLPPERR